MYIASKNEQWDAPLLASCVNSYGAAGSNCALLCCENPTRSSERDQGVNKTDCNSVYPIIISAASKGSLFVTAGKIGQYLEQAVPRPNIGDLAFTLSERRKHDRYCFTTTASEIPSLGETLETIGHDAEASFEAPLAPKRVVLAFDGQIKQNVGFHPGLYQSSPQVRIYIDECNDIVVNLGFSPILPANTRFSLQIHAPYTWRSEYRLELFDFPETRDPA